VRAGLFALAEGIQKVQTPHELSSGRWAIGVLLIVSAFTLAREMKSLLIGEAAQSIDVHAIREAILSEPVITEIEDLRTEQLGPDDILVKAGLV
jgi:divalent metal cation (Fe/Co/Zn/Cd) transporter